MMVKRVLITGACGFIGSHLCDGLMALGYTVRGLDNLDPQVHGPNADPPDYLHPQVQFMQGDVCDVNAVRRALDGVDAVIHLAARVGVAQSMYELSRYAFVNTYGTAVLLEAMAGLPIRKLIVASSMSVYGEGATKWTAVAIENGEVLGEMQPIATDEYEKPDLQSVYALTKYDQERMCLLWGRAYKVPTIALRFFNCYGTRQSLNNPYTGAMAIFASRLLNGKPPIIYEDGQQRRDFVHVSDIVWGIRLALESSIADEVINLGSGRYATILQVAQSLANVMGVDIKPEITGQHRTGDIRHCYADISKAKRLLNYEPQVWLNDGIRELVEWLKTQTAVDGVEQHKAELEAKGLLA
jgi:dTDP-L-rhamnose 4-epimerase